MKQKENANEDKWCTENRCRENIQIDILLANIPCNPDENDNFNHC